MNNIICLIFLMETLKMNYEGLMLLHITSIISIGIFIVYQYNKLYNCYNELKQMLENSEPEEQYLIVKYTKDDIEYNFNTEISDSVWKEMCYDDSIDEYVYMWVKDTFDIIESDSDSDSDYVPSESGTDSSTESISETESELSESDITELKITNSSTTILKNKVE